MPCHLLTLERSVYIRLAKIGDKSVGTEIGTKVRTIQDSVAFSWWPRSQIVQFSINLQVLNLLKDEVLVRAGDPADKFYLIARRGGRNTTHHFEIGQPRKEEQKIQQSRVTQSGVPVEQ